MYAFFTLTDSLLVKQSESLTKLRVPLGEPVSYHVNQKLTSVQIMFHATPVSVPITDSKCLTLVNTEVEILCNRALGANINSGSHGNVKSRPLVTSLW